MKSNGTRTNAFKTKDVWKLLGSAPSLKMLKEGVAKFYYCSEDEIEFTGEKVLNQGKELEGVRVVQKGKRFRFEGVSV